MKSVTNYARKDPGGEADPNPSSSAVSGEAREKGGNATEKDRINHVAVLAWTASGTKRVRGVDVSCSLAFVLIAVVCQGTFISAKGSPVFILCLGAPVELDLERWLPDLSEPTAAVNAESSLPASKGTVIPEAVGGEAAQKAKGRKPRKSKVTVPEPASETGVDPKGNKKTKEKAAVTQPKPRPTALPHEKLKINMVHGDVLILEGGDFIVCYLRYSLKCAFDIDVLFPFVSTLSRGAGCLFVS